MEKLFKRSICWAAPEGHWHQQVDGKPEPWLPFTPRTEETEEFVRNWARHYLRSYPKVQCVFIWPVDQSTEPERITRETLGMTQATDATADELIALRGDGSSVREPPRRLIRGTDEYRTRITDNSN